MNPFSRLAKAHTVTLIAALVYSMYETYKRRKMDESNSEKDKEIKKLREEVATLKKAPATPAKKKKK